MRPRRGGRGLLCGAVLLVACAGQAIGAGAAEPARGTGDGAVGVAVPRVELVTQTATVARGGTFEVWLQLPEVPADGNIELVLHNRVRSRSELAASMEGTGLRTTVYRVTTLIASLPLAADGSRHLSLSLDPAAGVAVSAAGAYPIELIARDAAGTPLDTLITHLVVRPDSSDASPPLAVAVVAQVDLPPALQPDGTVRFDDAALERAAGLVEALTAAPDVPATLAIRPETIDSLGASADPAHTALLDQLRAAATGRSVLSLPYVDVSPDALVTARLGDELTQQLERGRLVLANALGVDPSAATWLASRDLDLVGLRALEATGVRHVVVGASQVEPLRSGVLRLSLAQPFLLPAGRGPTVDAMALDPEITDRLDTSASPGLEVSRLIAELSVLWFEQPGIARGVILPVDTSVRGAVLRGLLEGLDGGGVFQATDLDDVFATAAPLLQPGGERIDRALVPDDRVRIPRSVAADLLDARDLLTSFTSLIGSDSPRAEPVAAQLLLATASGLDAGEHQAHLDAARAAVRAVVDAIGAPERQTITLTARDGTVPLTIRNDAGLPVDVMVRLRSPKLEFPDGDAIPLTLTEQTTRLDIAVRVRASGAFPLEVEVTSPDGALTLATVDYSVQSTAVSGVGVVLSAGAAIFLLVWWARHWSRTRRSAKLVSAAAADRAGAASSTDGPQPQ